MISYPFYDSRGHHGESGELHIAEDLRGTQFLVKSNPADVTNEYVAHRIARLIGVPTSDAVLIDTKGLIEVGILYEKDFKRANMDDFIGDSKYPDDSPLLAELMAYLALRDLIVLDDNPQLAFARKHLISFDYADSFYLSDPVLRAMQLTRDISLPLQVFTDHLMIGTGFRAIFRILQRPDSDFLIDAYLDPVFKFKEVNLQPILDDLKAVFPQVVPAFYEACFEAILKKIGEWTA